ncbi:hypothetical protein DVA86_09305 [Streptomyces armeniacus]|uniref:Uncharacterized protein n=1 Tax=Streptomyces armeniacus TaxID=83291 RepID=A0A345XMF0_9ACTN|nr:hypothetical protein [Streptomyces armeniacus]AXK32816.1 hypothetical protein DVA86_09305 [Streptomyces armeniacus]
MLSDVLHGVESGIVFCGAKAREESQRRRGAVEAVVVDPERYVHHRATIAEPFCLPKGGGTGQLSLLGEADDQLDGLLQGQRGGGSGIALTPTGYVGADDCGALRAVMERASELNGAEDIVVLPIDKGWLRERHLDFLTTQLSALPVTKALVLCDTRNPLERRGAATALRELVRVPRTGLLRTDLAGLDALAHGAVFSAIGVQTSMRHGRPPSDGGPPPTGRRATVLHPQLMRYFRCSTLHEVYGAQGTPYCSCTYCDGRALGRFEDTVEGVGQADLHNIAVWAPWAAQLQAEPDKNVRRSMWRSLCEQAVASHEEINRQLRRSVFKPDPALREWAGIR